MERLMIISRMKSWISLNLALILCSMLNDVTEASQAALVGTVYCDTCFHQEFSVSSHFISGALVAVECGGNEIQASGGKPSFREVVKTNVKGEFRVKLPFSATKQVNKIKRCSVKLITSSEPDCVVAATATSSSIRLKVKTPENHVFTAGFFTFQPLEQPKRCQRESHANSNDEIIASTPLPSRVVDGMLAPIPPLTDQKPTRIELHDLADENNFGSPNPVNQILPPLLVPSFPSQPPPDSMFIPEVPLPPDYMFVPEVPPPPDSMFNTGFQSPPDSILDPSQPSPPPSFPFPPLDPQPDLIQATPPPPTMPPQDSIKATPQPPSMLPPPPFNPPFPAFPFQPSAGLPRMPPGTKENHHLLD